MAYRFPLEARVDDRTFSFDLFWNDEGKLIRIGWQEESITPIESQPPYGVAAVVREMKAFFSSGEPLLPLHWSLIDMSTVSDFQKRVYEAVLAIPHGETRTYAWVAKKIGKPLAARAVGQALRRNPFPILVPCHRVVSDKSLGGFMGMNDPSDLELRFKCWLLDLERSFRNPCFPFMDATPLFQERVS